MHIDTISKLKISGPRRLLLAALVALVCDREAISQVVEAQKSINSVTAALVNISPWTYPDFRADFNGIETEIIKELSRLSGVSIDIKQVPYARELMMIETGAAVLTVGVRSEKIDQLTFPLAKLGMEDIIIITLAESNIHTVEDLPGKLVAQVRDSAYVAASIPDPKIRKYDTNGYDQSLGMLLEKRVDAVIGLRTSLLHAVRKNPNATSRVSPAITLGSREFCILISRNFKDAEAFHHLQDGARTLMQRNFFEHVRSEYRKSLGE